jgi:hypothetical protein
MTDKDNRKEIRNKKDRDRYFLKKTNGKEEYSRLLLKKRVNRKSYYDRHMRKVSLDASVFSNVPNPTFKTRVCVQRRVLSSTRKFPDTVMNTIFEYLGPGLAVPHSYQWMVPGIRIYYNRAIETNYRQMVDKNGNIVRPYNINSNVGQWYHCVILCTPFFDVKEKEWKVHLHYFKATKPWHRPWVGLCVAAQPDCPQTKDGYSLRRVGKRQYS